MGQEETFHLNSERMINNDKNLKNNNYIEYPTFKKVLRPSKSMFEFLYVVGRGGFGKVWMVKYKKTKFKYALKEMSKVKIIDRKSEKSIKNEREFLSKLNHPFIVNMICSFQDYDNLYLVMDLLTGGDLRYHICHKKQFNEEQSRFFSSCILLGLEYIHMNNIIHRDIKPENLVLDDKGYVRITDFGVSKRNLRDNSSETSGTPGYMAPEVLCALNHSFQVDFFALGVIIYEFMNGYRPYLGRNRKEIKEAVLAKQIHVHRKQLFENGWSFESGDLINKLLYRKPYKRLGANGIKEIKEHPWFKNINWEELFNKKLKSPFVPKEGDNFDKRYCEGIEQIDTQTRERYQYYKSKNKYKTLFLNYTFVREEEKQEFINDSNNNYNNIYNKENNNDRIKRKNTSNPTTTASTKISLGSKYNSNILIGNSYKNYINNKKSLLENINDNIDNNNKLIKKPNTNSMTNIHSFSILNDNFNNNKEIRYKNGNRNNKFINRFNQDNNEGGSENNNNENQKLFYSTFKIPNKSKTNNKLFQNNNINEIEEEEVENNIIGGYNDNNKMNELKAYINRNEEDNKKNKDNIHNASLNNNRSCYFRKRSKESNQFRIASSLNKKQNQNQSQNQNQNGYYSMNNNKKKDNTINIDFNNIKIDELKVFINRNEEDNKKNKDNIYINNNNNRSCYFRKRSKESNQFRIASSLNKKQNQNQSQNEYYSINNSKKISQIKNDNKYYNLDDNNNKNYTSIKININGPININKYNRSSSQTNIFYDTKGVKSNTGKIIKYFL